MSSKKKLKSKDESDEKALVKIEDINSHVTSKTEAVANFHELLFKGPDAALIIEALSRLGSKFRGASLTTEQHTKENFIKEKSLISRPESLDATFEELTNLIVRTFIKSEKNMASINSDLANTPKLFVRIFQALAEADRTENVDVEDVDVEDAKGSLTLVITRCKENAAENEKLFNYLMDYLEELIVAAKAKNAEQKNTLQELEHEKADLKRKKEDAEKYQQELEEEYRKLKEQHEQSLKDLQKAIDDMPGLGSIFLSSVTDCLKSAVGVFDVGNHVGNVYKKISTFSFDPTRVTHEALTQTIEKVCSQVEDGAKLSKSDVREFRKNIKDGIKTVKKVKADDPTLFHIAEIALTTLELLGQQLEEEPEISKKPATVKKPKNKKKNKKQTSRVEQHINVDTSNANNLEEVKKKFRDIIESLDSYETSTVNATQQNDNDEDTMTTTLIRAHREKKQAREDFFKNLTQLKENKHQQLKTATDSLTEILSRSDRLDMEKVDYETMIEYLEKGVIYLKDIKKDWDSMVRLFQDIERIIRQNLGDAIDKFIKTVNNVDIGKGAKMVQRADLLDNSLVASGICYIMCKVATSYIGVSQKFVTPQLENIGTSNDELSRSSLVVHRESLQSQVKEYLSGSASDLKHDYQKTMLKLYKIFNTVLDAIPMRTSLQFELSEDDSSEDEDEEDEESESDEE